jgi:hypothetical protein
MNTKIDKVPYPKIPRVCRNTDHWAEIIMWDKCKRCGGEIQIRKSDIPNLARQIEFGEQVAHMDDHDCKLDKFGTGHCDHPSHGYAVVEYERPETESEEYLLAH